MRVHLVLLLLLPMIVLGEETECRQFVDQLVKDILKPNFTNIPRPSIMYSGITPNNPGQKQECEEAQFNYFLVSIHNSTYNSETYTGICVPTQCSREDIDIALEDYLNCKVYDFPSNSLNALQITGLVLACLWVGILTTWSIVLSYRSPNVNEHIKKELVAEPINELGNREVRNKEDYKLFNYYEGYSRLFKYPKGQKNLTGAVTTLTVLSVLLSTQFSYRQSIASNEYNSYDMFDSLLGLLVCNTEIAFATLVFLLGYKLAHSLEKKRSFHEIGRFYFDHLLKKWALLIILSLSIYAIMGFIEQPLSQVWDISNGANCTGSMWEMWLLVRHLQLDCKVCLPWLWLLQTDILLSILAGPFVIIFRAKKALGYGLMGLLVCISIFLSVAFLDNQGIVFEPYRIFNMPPQFSVNYQTNTLVRMGPFFLGLLFAIFTLEGLDKSETETTQHVLHNKMRKTLLPQYLLHGMGLAIMIICYFLILAYTSVTPADQNPYVYISLVPVVFVSGLACFLLPCCWNGQNKVQSFVEKVCSWKIWSHFQKLSMCLYAVGPAVIGFTTYSMQNSIYFDVQTVVTYFLGDMLIIYLVSLLVAAGLESQLHFISNWLQAKVSQDSSKYSLVVVED